MKVGYRINLWTLIIIRNYFRQFSLAFAGLVLGLLSRFEIACNTY